MEKVPHLRIRRLNRHPLNPRGRFVLYWMTAYRRPFDNFALQRAAELAAELQRPLLILEALRCGYPYASDRLHRFILEGMQDNAAHFSGTGARYFPYLEERHGAGKGLLAALAASASAIVTDDFPAFFLPRMQSAAARQVGVCLETVDSNGLLPLRAARRAYPSAYAFRRFLQRELPAHLPDRARRDPLAGIEIPVFQRLPNNILPSWQPATPTLLAAAPQTLARLPIDHQIPPVAERGGWERAELTLTHFLAERLHHYPERSQPDRRVTSELSPYLHFGQISSHRILARLFDKEGWSPGDLSPETQGKRRGWWGLSEGAEAFLDELITWRELGFNTCCFEEDYDHYRSLPGWARESLEKHRADPRPTLYSKETLEQARTHDPLWNAAQRQLLLEGRMHNYLRMLWGKKILEWSPDAQSALQVMLELNDRYALDGRDPNSCSGIFWCLGRYDRPWGPERPIFGKIRYMTSENTARKFSVESYLERYAPSFED